MIQPITVEHVTFVTAKSFDEVVEVFHANVGTLEDLSLHTLASEAKDPADFEAKVNARIGKSGFTRFLTVNHGQWLTLQGYPNKSIMYVIGNPFIAITMIRHDVEAGLDVPVRVNIYEHKDGLTRFVFNKPSTLMSGLDNPEVTDAARKLDAKMMALGELIMGTQA